MNYWPTYYTSHWPLFIFLVLFVTKSKPIFNFDNWPSASKDGVNMQLSNITLTAMWVNCDSSKFSYIVLVTAVLSFQTSGNEQNTCMSKFHACIMIKYLTVNTPRFHLTYDLFDSDAPNTEIVYTVHSHQDKQWTKISSFTRFWEQELNTLGVS